MTTQATVLAADGVRVALTLHQRLGRQSAVIVCPGFFKSQQTATFRRLTAALAESQDVIGMDFRGHGRSTGWYTFSAKEGQDLEAVLAWARERYQRLGVLGFSLGAAVAITTLSRPGCSVASCIAVSAPSSFEEIEFKWWSPEAIRRGLMSLGPGGGSRPASPWMRKARPVEHVGKLAPAPLLLVHGTRDVIVGVDHSRRLYQAAGEPKRLEIFEGGSHAEALFRDEPDRFLRLVRDWFARTLA